MDHFKLIRLYTNRKLTKYVTLNLTKSEYEHYLALSEIINNMLYVSGDKISLLGKADEEYITKEVPW